MTAWILLACTTPDVSAEYREREASLATVPWAHGEDWKPEVALRLGEDVVSELLKGAVDEQLASSPPVELGPFGKATVRGELVHVKLVEPTCEACIGVRGRVEGTVLVKIGKQRRELPYTLRFSAESEFSTTQPGLRGRRLQMQLVDVRKLQVDIDGIGGDLAEPLKTWGKELLGEPEPVDLGPVGSEDLPLRDVRIRHDSGIRIEAVASTRQPAPIGRLPAWDGEGFQVVISEGVMLDAALTEAFAAGDVSGEHALQVHADPRELRFDDERYSMDMRLWRVAGKGWWRDYTLSGPLTLEGGKLRLATDTVEARGTSKGAAMVDPLAWLGEGYMMGLMGDAARGAFPARESLEMGGMRMTTTLTTAHGEGDALVLDGVVRVHGQKKTK